MEQDPAQLLLPPGSRILYIGPPKTGTTSLQESVHASRDILMDHGVYYPGFGPDHRHGIFAVLGHAFKLDKSLARHISRSEAGRVPSMKHWHALLDEVHAEKSRRVLVSHEAAAQASDELARTFVEAFGANRTHIVITLRPPSAILPSLWTQSLRYRETDTFDRWLQRVYGKAEPALPDGRQRYLDQGGLVERWAQAAGRENVTVIVLEPAQNPANRNI